MMIRVDKNKPISADVSKGFTSDQVSELLSQMQDGDEFILRYKKWPYKQDRDSVIDAFGFSEGWLILQDSYSKINLK